GSGISEKRIECDNRIIRRVLGWPSQRAKSRYGLCWQNVGRRRLTAGRSPQETPSLRLSRPSTDFPKPLWPGDTWHRKSGRDILGCGLQPPWGNLRYAAIFTARSRQLMKAPVPPGEPERLEALRHYGILDTLPERDFDD